jgi:hypothetical protein
VLSVGWRGAQHAWDLLANESPFPLLGPRDALDGTWFLHQRWIELRGNASHDASVLSRKSGRGDWHRGGAPDVVGGVSKIPGHLGLSGRGVEAGADHGCPVRHSDGRQPGQPRGEAGSAARLLGNEDLVKQPDRRVCGCFPLSFMDKLVERCSLR